MEGKGGNCSIGHMKAGVAVGRFMGEHVKPRAYSSGSRPEESWPNLKYICQGFAGFYHNGKGAVCSHS